MISINTQLLFGQINTISPKRFSLKSLSVSNDFAFVNKMFYKTGNNVWEGINAIKKSNNTERKGSSYW